MRIEISSAANFLVDLVRLSHGSRLNDKQLEVFRSNVCECLLIYYKDHWFPESPFKGSGYRCIRINGKMDPLIAQAGVMMGLAATFLRGLFPSELTMWVDPMEVAYRIGENGSICVLYQEKELLAAPTTPTKRYASPVSPPASPLSTSSSPQRLSYSPQAIPTTPLYLRSSRDCKNSLRNDFDSSVTRGGIIMSPDRLFVSS